MTRADESRTTWRSTAIRPPAGVPAAAGRPLTTKPDHNGIGTRPTQSEGSSGEVPGSRRQPTSWTYLTSEGSLVLTYCPTGCRARLRADDCGGTYCQRMADKRNALDKHLGITEQGYGSMRFDRDRALIEHVGQALTEQNYAAAQVYALLLLAERQENGRVDVHLTNGEELAIAIASNITPDLRRIAESIG